MEGNIFGVRRCPVRVTSRPDGPEVRLPLCPRKRTQSGHRAMSAWCQNQKSRRKPKEIRFFVRLLFFVRVLHAHRYLPKRLEED